MNKLSCQYFYEDDRFYWFSEMQFNGFYRVDKRTLEPELLFHFPKDPLEKTQLCILWGKTEEWFVFLPQKSQNIVLYHGNTKELKVFPLKNYRETRNVTYCINMKFTSVWSYENEIFFFPSTYPAIVKINLLDMTLTYLDQAVKKVDSLISKASKGFPNIYFALGDRKGDKIYLPLGKENQIGIYDLKTGELQLEEVNGKQALYNRLLFHGEDCYLLPRKGGDLLCWNHRTKEVEAISVVDNEVALLGNPFVHQKNFYLIDYHELRVYRMDLDTKTVQTEEFFQEILPDKHIFPNITMENIASPKVQGDILTFISGKTHDWYEVNLLTKEFTIKIIEADHIGEKIMSEKIPFFIERRGVGLESYLDYLISGQYGTTKDKARQTIGQSILEATN